MDPITHVTSGLLVGQALRGRLGKPELGAWFPLFCGMAAESPDIDVVAGFWGPEASLLYHRGLTHSLAGGFVLALVLALLPRLFGKKDLGYGRLVLVSSVCVLMHIGVDLLTSYGTQALLPFSDARLSFPLLPIVEPWYTLPMLGLVGLGFWGKRARRLAPVFGLVFFLAFPGLNLVVREWVENQGRRALQARGIAFERLHALPERGAPFSWKIIAEDQTSYRLSGLSLFHADTLRPLRVFLKADRDILRRYAQKDSFFATYDWFSDYLAVIEEAAGNEPRITFADLRYMSSNPSPSFPEVWPYPYFSLTAYLDRRGALARYVYHRGGTDTAFDAVR